jgi:hypothetical protein
VPYHKKYYVEERERRREKRAGSSLIAVRIKLRKRSLHGT